MQGRKTMQEVESIVLASWRAVQSERQASAKDSQILRRREAGILLELLDLPHLFTGAEGTAVPSRKVRQAKDGGAEIVVSETGVSQEELWEWLFTAPPPFACLTFLDDVADPIKRQLFLSLAPFLASRVPYNENGRFELKWDKLLRLCQRLQDTSTKRILLLLQCALKTALLGMSSSPDQRARSSDMDLAVRCACASVIVDNLPISYLMDTILKSVEGHALYVAREASQLCVRAVFYRDEGGDEYTDTFKERLAFSLADHLIRRTEPRSLLDLIINFLIKDDRITTSFHDQMHLLPDELQKMISKKMRELNGKRQLGFSDEADEGFRELVLTCYKVIYTPALGPQLVRIIDARLKKQVSWQVRSSGLDLLGILHISSNGRVDELWDYLDFMEECLYDSELHVRRSACWALSRMALASAPRGPHRDRVLNALASNMKHSLVAEDILSVLIEWMETECLQNESDEVIKKLINEAVLAYSLHANDPKLNGLLMEFFRHWHSGFSRDSDLASHGLQRILEVLTHAATKLAPDNRKPNAIKQIRSFIDQGKAFRPCVPLLCDFLHHELRWALQNSDSHRSPMEKESDQTILYQLLAESLRALCDMFAAQPSVLPFLRVEEIINVILYIVKEDGNTYSGLMPQVIVVLGHLAEGVPDKVVQALLSTKELLLDQISGQVSSAVKADRANLILSAVGKMAHHVPALVEADWLTSLLSTIHTTPWYVTIFASDSYMACRSLLRLLFQLGRKFSTCIPLMVVRSVHRILHHLSEVELYDLCLYDDKDKKIKELTGWAHVIRDHPDIPGRLQASFDLLHLALNRDPRLHRLIENEERPEEEDEEDCDEGQVEACHQEEFKQATHAMLIAVIPVDRVFKIQYELRSIAKRYDRSSLSRIRKYLECSLPSDNPLPSLFEGFVQSSPY